jgi:DNA adenine methylase
MSATAAAARFIYLNRFCFNGLYRTNAAGDFNVPFAPSGTGKLPSLSHLQGCAEVLKRTQLRCGDFVGTMELVQEGDFVYLDPPYAVSTRRVFREYSRAAFAQPDLVRLCRHLRRIDSMGARFLVSYADCTEARVAFRRWHIKRVRTRRNIAGFAIHRRFAFELIVTNINEGKR